MPPFVWIVYGLTLITVGGYAYSIWARRTRLTRSMEKHDDHRPQ